MSSYLFRKSMTKQQLEKLVGLIQQSDSFNFLDETYRNNALAALMNEIGTHILDEISQIVLNEGDGEAPQPPPKRVRRKRRTPAQMEEARKAAAEEEAQLAAEEAAETKSE